MVDFEEEISIFREVLSISGDILFKYDIKSDTMHIIGAHSADTGNGYDICNYVAGIHENGTILKENASEFEKGFKQGFPEYFDENVWLYTKSGRKCHYRAIGKKKYDDDWNELGIIGKLISLGEVNETDLYGNTTNNSVEFTVEDKDFVDQPEKIIKNDEKESVNGVALDIVEEALDILANTGNIGISVTSILQKIGDMFDLDCVTIQEYAQDGDKSSPCIQWYDEANRMVCDKIARLPFDNFQRFEWNDESVIVIEDLSAYTGDNIIVNKMKDIEIRSVVICKYSEKGQDIGWISFENHHSTCKWNDEMIRTFSLVSKLISVYLIDMKSYLELLKKQELEKTHDAITGLPKYELFLKKSVSYINLRCDDKLAIVFFELNNLEKINKIYGRIMGDEILAAFTKEYEKFEDRFVIGCRVNANNFVALINQFDTRGNKISTAMIEHMNSSFEKICKEKCPEANVVVYAGITFLPSHVEHLDNYIGKARQAMESAREEGISCGFAY